MAPEHVTDIRGANAAFAITQNKIGVTPAVPPLATDHVEHRIHEAIVVMVRRDHNHLASCFDFPVGRRR